MSRWSDVIRFLTTQELTNDNGYLEEKEVIDEHETFANRKSIRSNEFYQANAIDVRLEVMFEVRSVEYSEQEKLVYNEKIYDIVRTYDKGEIIELICSKEKR